MLVDTLKFRSTASQLKKEDGINRWKGADFLDIASWTSLTPAPNEKIMKYIAVDTFVLPAGLGGSYAESKVAATDETTYLIKKNGSSIGSIVFASGESIAAFVFASNVTVIPGDLITIEAPATIDLTHDKISFTLRTILQ